MRLSEELNLAHSLEGALFPNQLLVAELSGYVHRHLYVCGAHQFQVVVPAILESRVRQALYLQEFQGRQSDMLP